MNRFARSFACSFAAAVLLAGCASPALEMAASAEEAGFSTRKLREMSAAFQARVDAGEIPGAVLLVARDNRIVWHEAVGYLDREAGTPMTTDAIFRVASMTKPLTSLAVMMLQEEGKLRIGDPVSRYLPEFRDLQVGVQQADATGKPVLVMQPAKSDITILDLLRHTSGITYGFIGTGLVKDLYNKSDLFNPKQSSSEFAAKLAKLPLVMQPATAWDYGMSHDVLARLVEVVAGQGFDQFVQQRILQPLRMTQTGFWAQPAQHSRIAEPQAIKATGRRPPFMQIKEKPAWSAGGHGLVSSAADYARFCQMVLNGGTLDGVRLVRPETVATMRTNHLTPDIVVNPAWNAMGVTAPTADNGQGFGLGFAVRVSEGKNRIPGSIGDISWGGANGTYFWIDPKERLFAVLMMQAPSPINASYRALMRTHVYGALRN